MRANDGLRRWTRRHPAAWLCLTQGLPMLVIGFAAAIAMARAT